MLSTVESPISEKERFIRFVLTGGIAAGVNVASRWLLEFIMSYEVAVAVAYILGMTTAFILARMFVFPASALRLEAQYGRFALVNAVAFLQVWLISVGLARLLFPAVGFTRNSETLAHLIGVSSPILTSFLGHKHFSFSE